MKNKDFIDLRSTLEDYLWEHIPISKAMGVRVDSASLEKVILEAPFTNNINHKKTVFGGSLHIESCKSTGFNSNDHFRGVTKMILLDKGLYV